MSALRTRTQEIAAEYWAARESQTERVAVAQVAIALAQAELRAATPVVPAEGPQPGDYPEEGPVPTGVQNVWNEEPHEDTPTADLAAELLGSEWHEHPLATPSGKRLIWRHRHERLTAEERVRLAASPSPDTDREIERLRRQNHDNAAMRDRENGELRSKVAEYERAMAEARERVAGWPVDWTAHPPSQEPDGWWRYTSENHRHEVAALIEAVRRPSPDTDAGLDVRDEAIVVLAMMAEHSVNDVSDGNVRVEWGTWQAVSALIRRLATSDKEQPV